MSEYEERKEIQVVRNEFADSFQTDIQRWIDKGYKISSTAIMPQAHIGYWTYVAILVKEKP